MKMRNIEMNENEGHKDGGIISLMRYFVDN